MHEEDLIFFLYTENTNSSIKNVIFWVWGQLISPIEQKLCPAFYTKDRIKYLRTEVYHRLHRIILPILEHSFKHSCRLDMQITEIMKAAQTL